MSVQLRTQADLSSGPKRSNVHCIKVWLGPTFAVGLLKNKRIFFFPPLFEPPTTCPIVESLCWLHYSRSRCQTLQLKFTIKMLCLTKAHLTVRTCHLLGTHRLGFQVCFRMKTVAHLQTLWRNMHCSVCRREYTFFCFSLAIEVKWLCRSAASVPAFCAQFRKIDLNYQAARQIYWVTSFYAHDIFNPVFVLV